ncbi:SDR family NAD(P)-dependent oxidoreductase [Arthrobacter roseus]|uniref:SDR family NAD(P)-dependent oxidoreductase n=1 Tax=Arthrobacter roseus TaxID=136274 RepID=UPI00196255EA|nr:SDR family NAD(P)-dependent oxidoreductase [Arthrobacter roseus]MBM7847840.1 NAD(P)-dependent dehydrogenase (short-subunit alcohol dehydrogenase family) [Arthrobacter roseus]
MTGKTVLIFGGGSGGGVINNGIAAALTYAREGARLFIADNDAVALQDGLALLRKEQPEAVVTGTEADVTDSRAVKKAVDACVAAIGAPNVLHNNVGIAPMGGPLEMTEEEWNKVLAVNLSSAFITTKHVLPHLLQTGGAIVNIASIGGMRYLGYNYPGYAASKGGLIQFTKSIALEYANRGVRANCVAPGFIETPMMYQQIAANYSSTEQMLKARNAVCPTGSMGNSFDVANAALFLASDESKYINGVCLPVDGGLVHSVPSPT